MRDARRPAWAAGTARIVRAAVAGAAIAALFRLPTTASVTLAAQTSPSDQRAKGILKELVEINTTESAGSTTVAAKAMARRLKAAGFEVDVLGPNPRKENLVARWRAASPAGLRPILLLAHLDVVEARREDWSFDPFTFLEKDGYFYGRGVADDKEMGSQFVANLIRLKDEGFQPARDVILALTADEEGGDFNGVDWLLKNHRPMIDAAFAINEGGGGVVRKGKYTVNEVQAAEKVYQDFRFEVRNVGGHSSLPVKDNAISRLAGGLERLGAFEFPIRVTDLTRAYFARAAEAEEDADLASDFRAVGAAQADDAAAAAARLAESSPYLNAMIRTTCVATRLEGGHANNALPQLAAATVNCRLLPGDSPDAVRRQLVAVLADPGIDVTFIGAAQSSEATALLPEVMTAVETLTSQMFPGVIVVPVMSTGATDGLFLRNAGIPTFGIDATFSETDDVRAHGRDERIGARQYFEALEFQYRLIKLLAGARH